MIVCFSVLALHKTGDLSSLYPAPHPVGPGIGPSPAATLIRISRRESMDGQDNHKYMHGLIKLAALQISL